MQLLCLAANLVGVFMAVPQESWVDAFRAGKLADALTISESQLKTSPRDAALWTERALTLGGLGRNEESIKCFQRAIELRPTFIPALEGAAELTYKSHDPQAQRFVTGLLKVDPGNSTAHAMAGVLAFEKRGCHRAIEHFEQAGSELGRN